MEFSIGYFNYGMNVSVLGQLALVFGMISIMAIGGANTVIPEMQLQAVQNYHWLKGGQFADLYALSQVAPGPSSLIVTLIGYKAAGLLGAVVATIAMTLPSGMLVYFVAKYWVSARNAAWRHVVQHAFAPLTLGLILSSGVIVAKVADVGLAGYIITAITTVVFTLTKWNPLIVLLIAGVLGVLFLIR